MKKIQSGVFFLFKHGPRNFIMRIYNRFVTWETESISAVVPEGTSVTDSFSHISYLDLCGSLDAGTREFNNFRRNKSIISVYDHVPLDIGNEYLEEIQVDLETRVENFDWAKVLEIDSIGRPLRYYFRRTGLLSPTMLRYVKTVLDFENQFPTANFEHIAEIGVGFGGQSSLILGRWNLKSYTYYDLPEVHNVVRHFLAKSNLVSTEIIEYRDGRTPLPGVFDFVFSNYAFSELDRETQDKYLDNVILQSKHGYITWNNLGNYYHGAYSLADLVRLIPNSQISPEVPLTSKYNAVITW